MATGAEIACLAAEGEQIIMAAVIAIDPGKPFVQVTAINKSIEYLLLYPTVNHTGPNQLRDIHIGNTVLIRHRYSYQVICRDQSYRGYHQKKLNTMVCANY